MKYIFPLLTLILIFSSCTKIEKDFIWEKSYSRGSALFIRSTADSGFVSCGKMNDKPYLIRLSKERNMHFDFNYQNEGLFSAVWSDTSSYLAVGNTDGKMLLTRFDNEGVMKWDTALASSFYVDVTTICSLGGGNFLAVGSASADSADAEASGILFVKFDTTGTISVSKDISSGDFIAANDAVVDQDGNVYLALTRQSAGSKPTACVAKYSSDLNKLWEKELYNNPNFSASTKGIITDGSGSLYVTGKTEISSNEGEIDNSFIASVSEGGTIQWKKYREYYNAGTRLAFRSDGTLMMLNVNCFVISLVDPADGTDIGTIRIYSACDAQTTDSYGSDFDINYENNLLLAGSKGDNYYMALKSYNE